jgi:hypothetical protein
MAAQQGLMRIASLLRRIGYAGAVLFIIGGIFGLWNPVDNWFIAGGRHSGPRSTV